MVRFSIFGIPVEIQPWFWLTLGLLGSLWTGDGASAAGILMIFLFILAGFISVLIHELGHHFGFSDDDMEAIEAAADND